ncbi:MAG TPA: MFS transporter [Euryarchaeota archaeon]|nr:MFS transporter [Euryarchaeota archaeon]
MKHDIQALLVLDLKTPWHLRILYISTFLLRLAFGALLIVIANYIPGGSDYDKLLNVAIIAVPYPLAEMLTANYFGIKSDRMGRKNIIVAGTTLAGIVTVLYTLSNNVAYLSVMHGIHGIGAAATVAPAIAMIADHAHVNDRGRQMGWFDYSTFLGYIFGAVIGGFSIEYLGNVPAFLLIAGALFGSALLLFKLVHSEAPRTKAVHYGNWDELRKVFRVREIREIFPIWLIIAILLGLAITYLPRIMLSEGVSGSQIGIMFALAGAALGLLQPFWGKLSDRFGRVPIMTYGILSITGIIMMVLIFREETFTRTEDGLSFGIGIIPLGIFGLGAGAFVPSALAMITDCSDDSCYGATMGLYSFALGFGAFVAEGMGLALIWASGDDSAPLWLLYFAAVLVFLAVCLIVIFFIGKPVFKAMFKKNSNE